MGSIVKYLGKLNLKCEMCLELSGSNYLWKPLFEMLYDNAKELVVCEECAKRETGHKIWKTIKEKLNGNT